MHIHVSILIAMHKVNALKIRQSFGKILQDLKKQKEPILIEKGREPVAVLIPIEVFQKRFIDYREKEKVERLVQLARTSATQSPKRSIDVLRDLRYDSSR